MRSWWQAPGDSTLSLAMVYGNRPNDGGWLILFPDEHSEMMADPVATSYIKKYDGACEFLHCGDRYCLWLADAKAGEVRASLVLRRRVERVRDFRVHCKAVSTRELASPCTCFTGSLSSPAHASASLHTSRSGDRTWELFCWAQMWSPVTRTS